MSIVPDLNGKYCPTMGEEFDSRGTAALMLAVWSRKGINGVRGVDGATNGFTSGAIARIILGEQIKVPLKGDFIRDPGTEGNEFDGSLSRQGGLSPCV